MRININSDEMGKLNIVLDDKKEEKFRRAVFEKKGMKKGNISDAIEEAIDLWMAQEDTEKEKK